MNYKENADKISNEISNFIDKMAKQKVRMMVIAVAEHKNDDNANIVQSTFSYPEMVMLMECHKAIIINKVQGEASHSKEKLR